MKNTETNEQTETKLEGCSFVLNPIIQADLLETTSRAHVSTCDTQKLLRSVDTAFKQGTIALFKSGALKFTQNDPANIDKINEKLISSKEG